MYFSATMRGKMRLLVRQLTCNPDAKPTKVDIKSQVFQEQVADLICPVGRCSLRGFEGRESSR
jgi:hypothetical protein